MSKKYTSLQLISLILIIFIGKSASYYFVAKNERQFKCITDTDDALSWNDRKNVRAYSDIVSGFIPRRTNSNFSHFDCGMESADESACLKFWRNWTLINSLEGPAPKNITDRRWETFILLDSKKINVSKIENEKEFRLPFSVKLMENAEIHICFDSKTCSYVKINETAAEIGIYNEGKNPYSASQESKTSYIPNKWMHIEILIKDQKLSANFLSNVNNLAQEINIKNGSTITVRSSDERSVWRLHSYEYIHTIEDGKRRLGPPLQVTNHSICFSFFLAMCENCEMNILLSADEEGTDGKLFLEKNFQEVSTWNSEKIVITYNESVPENLYLFIETSLINNASDASKFWAIDEIRECQQNEYRQIAIDNTSSDSIYCQILGKSDSDISPNSEIRNDTRCSDTTIDEFNFCVPCQWIYYQDELRNLNQCFCSNGYYSGNCAKVGGTVINNSSPDSTDTVTEIATIKKEKQYHIIGGLLLVVILLVCLIMWYNKSKGGSNYKLGESNLEQIQHVIETEEFGKQLDAMLLKNKKAKIDENELNFCRIDGYTIDKCFIISKDSDEITGEVFWLNLWKSDVQNMIILNDLRNKECDLWPGPNTPLNFRNNFGVSLTPVLSLDGNVTYERRMYEMKMKEQIKKVNCLKFTVNREFEFIQNLSIIAKALLKFQLNTASPIMLHCCWKEFTTIKMLLFCDWSLRMGAIKGTINIKKCCKYLWKQNLTLENVKNYKDTINVLNRCLNTISDGFTSAELLNDIAGRISTNDFIKLQKQYLSNNVQTKGYEKNDMENDLYITSGMRAQLEHDFPFMKVVPIDGLELENEFLTTNTPETFNVGDFWRLLAQNEISKIIALNGFRKDVFPNEKCSFITSLGEIQLEMLTFKKEENYNLIMVHLAVADKNIKRALEIFIYKHWPIGSDLPTDKRNFFEFINEINPVSGHSLVICSDGVTASGLFVTVLLLKQDIFKNRVCNLYYILNIVRRNCQQFLTKESQLQFLYTCARIFFLQKTMIH